MGRGLSQRHSSTSSSERDAAAISLPSSSSAPGFSDGDDSTPIRDAEDLTPPHASDSCATSVRKYAALPLALALSVALSSRWHSLMCIAAILEVRVGLWQHLQGLHWRQLPRYAVCLQSEWMARTLLALRSHSRSPLTRDAADDDDDDVGDSSV